VLRSLISASPEAKKTIPHGTSRLSATVPASLGCGGPVGVELALGVGVGVALGAGDAVGLDGGPLDGAGLDVPGSVSSAQPANAPTAAPAETSRNWRRETMTSIVTARVHDHERRPDTWCIRAWKNVVSERLAAATISARTSATSSGAAEPVSSMAVRMLSNSSARNSF
jgi:hypothetical protein